MFPDTDELYKCDLVLLAMGFLGPEKSVVKELSIDCDPRSNMKTPPNKYNTSVPKVYAAGDCRLVCHCASCDLILGTVTFF